MSEIPEAGSSDPDMPPRSDSDTAQGDSPPLRSGSQLGGDQRAVENRSPDAGDRSKKSTRSRSVRANEGGQERQALMRLSSAGFELASFSLILGGSGYAIDHYFGNETPYVGIAGLLLGFSLGFYRLILLASRLS